MAFVWLALGVWKTDRELHSDPELGGFPYEAQGLRS